MIESYSKNITVATGSMIPLNTVSILKGTTVQQEGAAALQFNKCGVYQVCVNCSAVAGTAGNLEIQLQKDDVLVPNAISTATAADTTSIYPLSFTTLVQVPHNNCQCNACSAPTEVSIINTGQPATFKNVNAVITKIC